MGVMTTGQAKALKEREADEALAREQAEAWSESNFIKASPYLREQIRRRAYTLSQRERDERGIVVHDLETQVTEGTIKWLREIVTPDMRHDVIAGERVS